MKKILLLTLISSLFFGLASAQEKNPWTLHTSTDPIVKDKSVSRLSFPKNFILFDLNHNELRDQLFRVVENRVSHTVNITLPNADGGFEQFEIVEASNFEPTLQTQFPDIRAFSGRGITDRYATLKLSYSPEGIQTTVFRTGKPNEFMENYSADATVYAVFRSERPLQQMPWRCHTPEEKLELGLNDQVVKLQMAARSGENLKTIRLAQSCNGEYSNYFGAFNSSQVNLVLAAFNATLTRCNGVYEKDLALHLILISNTATVIYYDPATDPYTTMSNWNSQLQTTLTNNIGESNYDIGHMFGASGGGGNAGCIGCICVNGSKGKGITSPADGVPRGDNFDIDYVAHEVGHQLGGNHTFSQSNEGTGVNKEPGSGITIMGYAGITSQDMANHSIDIFHQTSIAQIQTNLNNKTCPVTTGISANNRSPVISPLTSYTIPISTPFALTASATDADGDPLTYCWEQNDNASSTQTGSSSVASATKATGPNWITFPAVNSPVRYFPRLSTILAGGLITGPLTGGDAGANSEALSSVSRTLNFRVTVRDNAPFSSTTPVEVGQTQFADVVVTVSNTSGPFNVTSPNTNVNWAGGSTQNITWNVANTTLSPVSCANVMISLSTDGGQTFPTVLVASTPNDGSEAVVIPATPSTTARIKVESVGNIFFDISNTNFTISGSVVCGSPTGLASSLIGDDSATINWNAVTNALSYAVEYKVASSATWISLSTAQTATFAKLTGLTQGTLYDWRVRATCSGGAGAWVTGQFTTTEPFVCRAPSGLNATAVTWSSATLNWTAVSGAVSYSVDYKKASDSNWINVAAATTSTNVNLSGLDSLTTYDYRVSTDCGTNGASGFSTAQFTTPVPFVCNAPSGLAAGSVTTSSANISWSAVNGAASYRVEYKAASSATWIVFASATTSTSANLSGLTSSTLYDYRVSTSCGASGTSGFSSGQFTTATQPACVTAFEPNESISAAALITSGVTNSAAISSSTDNDYFRITTTALSNITYNLVGPSGVDFDMTVFNSSGTQIGAGTSTTATETVSLTNQAAGTYYIRVFGYNGAFSSTCYTIRATATTVTTCQNGYDIETANNANTGAATIPFSTDIKGLVSPAGDVDNYKFTITTGGSITLTLTTLPANYNLRLVNSAGTILKTSSKTGTNNESISVTVSAGTYYARVYGASTSITNSTSCYTLRVTRGTAVRMEDIPVSVVENAMEVFPNPVVNTLNLRLNNNFGLMDVEIVNQNGSVIRRQRFSGVNAMLDVNDLPAGMYMVKARRGREVISSVKFVKQ